MKSCINCGEMKPLTDFYRHPQMADGRLNICKECHKARMTLRRRTDPVVQAYDRLRSRTPKRRQRIRENAARWRQQNPEGYRAQTAVNNAVRDRRLKREQCAVCGTVKNLHAHHPDYNEPLTVEWLCALHHQRMHADENRRLRRLAGKKPGT